MSLHRENVTWQSADGTWNLGFYEIVWQGSGDPEWDVEYGDAFWWVTTGHPTEDDATRAWEGCNPGGTSVLAYSVEAAAECLMYDEKAKRVKEAGESWGRKTWADMNKRG